MDREEERIYDNRKDFRSEDRFKEDIRHYSELERKYLYQFVEVHNRRRHKRDLTIENWGSIGSNVVTSKKDVKKCSRPDFILNRCYDNSYLIKSKQPIEVQTCSSLNPSICYIKKAKVEWVYDNVTEEVCDKKVIILFVLGSNHPNREKYSLLPPDFISKIKNRGLKYPKIMGNKPCYYFNVTEVNWKSFDSTTSQQTLDNTNNNDENIPLYKMMGED